MPRYLVTGGAGYVGSHCVLALLERGAEVVVLDNLRTGHRAAVPAGVRFLEVDLADRAVLADLFGGTRFDAVLHFAAMSLVGESMRIPMRYIADNVGQAMNLIEASPIGTEVGVIDGAAGPGVRVVASKGFASGAPAASNHGSAVASLLAGAGVSRVRIADVYGTDRAGGNALAIARALGWLVASGSACVPSASTMKLASSPSRHSSTSTEAPAAP